MIFLFCQNSFVVFAEIATFELSKHAITMKIGLLSDTHCCCDPRIAGYLGECDQIWHAGDIGDLSTLQWLSGIGPELKAVCGNIDPWDVRRHCPELLVFETAGAKVVMTHIGGYPGKYSRGIKELLKAERPVIFVSGHSHLLRVMFDRDLGCLHINPGAAGYHGWQQVRTLVRFEIEDGIPRNLEVIELGNKKDNET